MVERGDVVRIRDAVGAKRAQDLSRGVHGEPSEGQPAKQTVSERHGRVEVRAGVAGDIDAEHVGARPPRKHVSKHESGGACSYPVVRKGFPWLLPQADVQPTPEFLAAEIRLR